MYKTLAPLLATLVLAGCATTRMSDTEKLAFYEAHAGEPVKDIRYRNPMGWDKVDDQHLLLNMRPNESWLIKLSGPCLDYANAYPTIMIDASFNRLSVGFDRVKVPGNPISCKVEEIRPVDIAAVREARKAMDTVTGQGSGTT